MQKRSKTSEFNVIEGDQKMITGYLGALLILFGPIWIMWWHITFEPKLSLLKYLGLWLVATSCILVCVDWWAHKSKLLSLRKKIPLLLTQRFPKAVYRWMAWNVILVLCILIYLLIPVYQTQEYNAFWEFLIWTSFGWLVLGLPYLLSSLKYYYGYKWDKTCPAILFLCLMRRFNKQIKNILKARNIYTYRLSIGKLLWTNRNARAAWIGVLGKVFFIPITVVFFVEDLAQAYHYFALILSNNSNFQEQSIIYHQASLWYPFLYYTMYLVDVIMALIGYVITSRLLNSEIKSMDFTGLGLVSCVLCYPPWNIAFAWYFNWPAMNVLQMSDTPYKLIVMVFILLLFAFYVWATLAFGLKFSNLSYRGIFTRGPYKLCRHPAYVGKCASWWVECLPNLTTSFGLVGMIGWTLTYVIRALTEEKHLEMATPKYNIYKEYVKYKFIPGVF